MPLMEGASEAHKARSLEVVATLAGVDLDGRLCLVAAAGVVLVLIGSSRVELLLALAAFLRAAWIAGSAKGSLAGGPPWAGPRKCAEVPPRQRCHRQAPAEHHRWPRPAESSDGQPQQPGEPVGQQACGTLPRVRGRDLRPRPRSLAPGQPCQKYLDLIIQLGHAKQCGKALEVLTEMRQEAIEPNVTCFTALISACDKGNQPEKALELFETMQKEGVEPTVVTFNALISACGNGKMPEKALEKYAEMQEMGLIPNVVTYTSLIRACGQSPQPQRAWQVFDAMKEAGEKPNVVTFSSLLQAAVRCQDPEKGLRIFAEMEEACIKPSLFVHNNLASCWRNQPQSRALAAFRSMQDEGIPLGKSARSAVMTVCAVGDQRGYRGKRAEAADTGGADEPERGWGPDTTAACNARIIACSKGKTPEDALKVLAEMKQKGPKPDAVSYKAAIRAGENSRMPRQSLQLFREMLDEGMPLDLMVCNCAIRCCEQLRDADMATSIFENMKKLGVTPTASTYGTLIHICQFKSSDMAMDLIKEMENSGLTPNCYAYNAAISASCNVKLNNGKIIARIGAALDLFRSMKEAKVVPDAITYTALIGACEKRGWLSTAEELFSEMKANGIEPDVIAYTVLISCWGKAKNAERPVQLLEEMLSKGVAPNAITYNTLAWACGKGGDRAKARDFKQKEAECVREGRASHPRQGASLTEKKQGARAKHPPAPAAGTPPWRAPARGEGA